MSDQTEQTVPAADEVVPESYVERTVVSPCRLTFQDGHQEYFGIGTHKVSQEVADHWFFAAHTDNPPDADVRPGTPEFVLLKAKEDHNRRLLEASAAQGRADALREEAKARGAAAASQGRHRVAPVPIEQEGPPDEAELQGRAQAVDAADAHAALGAAARAVEHGEGARIAKVAEATRQDELAKAPLQRRRLAPDKA